MTALDDYFVGYGPEQIEDIQVHERPDGSAVIETVSIRPIRVWDKRPDGSLVELFGQAADTAIEAFLAAFDDENNNANGSHA
jgi:hypothetical protein